MSLISLLSLIFSFCSYTKFAHGYDFTDKATLATYIVHVNKPEGKLLSHSDHVATWHHSFLPTLTTQTSSADSNPRLIYSYNNAISGFAARLTEDEVEAMKEKNGFVSSRPERVLRRLTTHSPTFLGLHKNVGFLKESNFGNGVIIGMLDSGAFPNHPSFSDQGMSPPPTKWKGKCEFNVSHCNNKVIGARTFRKGAMANREKLEPPNNDDGHGTHTASTAAGQFVNDASVLGNAKGTAVGIAPRAHLAIYKVCYFDDCPESDMLAGIDAAIGDGVDVLSMSIGIDSVPFYDDPIAIGGFSAVRKGIFVSCGAGNSGPSKGVIMNDAPWILTVGASTIDRRISAVAKLGNGEGFEGESLFQPSDFPATQLPLVYAGNGTWGSEFCGEGSLNDSNVKGKIVLCERGGGIGRIVKGEEVKLAGGAAMILTNDQSSAFNLNTDAHVLPATHISFNDGNKIKSYINSTTTPTSTIIFQGTLIGNDPSSPAVASFSSRGPSAQTPGILKPDIIGPGVNILAAWPFPIDDVTKTSNSYFNFMSGTSMSCPHLSGIAALLKSSHPSWSPAAIKSAIMTTADVTNLGGNPIVDETLEPAGLFAVGAGHVNPSRANEPGLVYDIHPDEYTPYLCGLGYTEEQVGIITHRKVNCSEKSTEGELNYPSLSVALGPSRTLKRTVTNVGDAKSRYGVIVSAPRGVGVSVKPTELWFTERNEKATYWVTFSRIGSDTEIRDHSEGELKWVSGKYSVRSPISVTFA